MKNEISLAFENAAWLDEFIRISLYFLIAGLVSLISKWTIRQMARQTDPGSAGVQPRAERRKTIQSLVSSAINLAAFIAAILLSVGQFVQPDTLVWMVGLFSAAFGLGARPLISDYLSGLSFIFEDTFSVGEKVEIHGPPLMEGVVEAINLRTTMLRSPTGELYVTPNGEIRTVRNFSRGKFSIANVSLKISASDLGSTLSILEALGGEAVSILPNLIEPWQVISPKGQIAQYTELTILAKARFGKAAEMGPRLLSLIQERLAEADITLAA